MDLSYVLWLLSNSSKEQADFTEMAENWAQTKKYCVKSFLFQKNNENWLFIIFFSGQVSVWKLEILVS